MANSKEDKDYLEKEIEAAWAKYAKAKGVYCRKFVSPGRVGVPDRVFVFPNGKVVFVEAKALGKLPTRNQWMELKALHDTGVPVYVIDTVSGGEAMVDYYREWASRGPVHAYYSDPEKLIESVASYGWDIR